MDHYESSTDALVRRQAEARLREQAGTKGIGTPGYAPPEGFSFSEATGRGTAVRLATLLAIPLVAFLGLAAMGGETGAGLVLVLWVGCGAAFYLLPIFEAHLRKQPNFVSIALVDVFLGWTLVGWVVAMAWGCAARQQPTASESMPKEAPASAKVQETSGRPISVADELGKLAALKAQGILSDEEFAVQKAKVLAR
jgi:hypothetical protein